MPYICFECYFRTDWNPPYLCFHVNLHTSNRCDHWAYHDLEDDLSITAKRYPLLKNNYQEKLGVYFQKVSSGDILHIFIMQCKHWIRCVWNMWYYHWQKTNSTDCRLYRKHTWKTINQREFDINRYSLFQELIKALQIIMNFSKLTTRVMGSTGNSRTDKGWHSKGIFRQISFFHWPVYVMFVFKLTTVSNVKLWTSRDNWLMLCNSEI